MSWFGSWLVAQRKTAMIKLYEGGRQEILTGDAPSCSAHPNGRGILCWGFGTARMAAEWNSTGEINPVQRQTLTVLTLFKTTSQSWKHQCCPFQNSMALWEGGNDFRISSIWTRVEHMPFSSRSASGVRCLPVVISNGPWKVTMMETYEACQRAALPFFFFEPLWISWSSTEQFEEVIQLSLCMIYDCNQSWPLSRLQVAPGRINTCKWSQPHMVTLGAMTISVSKFLNSFMANQLALFFAEWGGRRLRVFVFFFFFIGAKLQSSANNDFTLLKYPRLA